MKELDFDIYREIINGKNTYNGIAQTLLEDGSCIIGWSDGETDHRDILFTYKATKYGYLQGGLQPYYLFVSIIDFCSFGFVPDEKKHPNYIKEKLRLQDNYCDDRICDLINGVITSLNQIGSENK